MSQAKQGSTPTVMRPFVSLSTIQAINTAAIHRQPKPVAEPQRRKANTALGRAYSAERQERVVQLSEQGWSASAIAEELSIHTRSVQKIRTKSGWSTAKVTQTLEWQKLRAKRLLHDGASYQEVARTLSRSPSTVAAWHPGFQWSNQKAGQAATLARKAKKVERLTLAEKV